ncbi:hypothetical protein [Sediminitomix flava]|nr:hypothetical protein [Sediminitomix flava]
MIQSKPKGNTVFALTAFFVLLIGGIIYTNHNASENGASWFHIVSLVISVVVAVVVLVMLMFRIKLVSVDRGKMKVNYPLRFRKSEMDMKEQLFAWQEDQIETNGMTFKEMTILFKGGDIVKLSNQEDSGYGKIHNYLTKKFKKQRQYPKPKDKV